MTNIRKINQSKAKLNNFSRKIWFSSTNWLKHISQSWLELVKNKSFKRKYMWIKVGYRKRATCNSLLVVKQKSSRPNIWRRCSTGNKKKKKQICSRIFDLLILNFTANLANNQSRMKIKMTKTLKWTKSTKFKWITPTFWLENLCPSWTGLKENQRKKIK